MTAREHGRNAKETNMPYDGNSDDVRRTSSFDAAPLSYEGKVIRRRDEMLNLTDMWRAAGGPAMRRPSFWLRQEQTERFRSFQRSLASLEFNVRHDHIKSSVPDPFVAVDRGQGGSTWAHWQLALAYAQYLSPAFHSWCNTVVRDAMQNRRGPPNPRSALVRNLERQLDRLHNRLDDIERTGADTMAMLLSVRTLMAKERNEFTKRTRSLMCEVASGDEYDGQCPACFATPVVGEDKQPIAPAEFDHFYHAGMNKPLYGWLICRPCHLELTNGGHLARFGRMERFRDFQSNMRELLARKYPPLSAASAR